MARKEAEVIEILKSISTQSKIWMLIAFIIGVGFGIIISHNYPFYTSFSECETSQTMRLMEKSQNINGHAAAVATVLAEEYCEEVKGFRRSS